MFLRKLVLLLTDMEVKRKLVLLPTAMTVIKKIIYRGVAGILLIYEKTTTNI